MRFENEIGNVPDGWMILWKLAFIFALVKSLILSKDTSSWWNEISGIGLIFYETITRKSFPRMLFETVIYYECSGWISRKNDKSFERSILRLEFQKVTIHKSVGFVSRIIRDDLSRTTENFIR